jgi:hypothetical protein
VEYPEKTTDLPIFWSWPDELISRC